MNLEILFGIGIIAIGAFASGSFSIPFEKTKVWNWENNWLIYCLFAYVLVPTVACAIFCPNFIDILYNFPSDRLLLIFSLGVVYGICNLTFGLSLRYLGISLGFMISLGLMMILGTIIPPSVDGRLNILLQQAGGTTLIIGLLVASMGIVVSAYAGYRKDKSATVRSSELNFGKGIAMALFVGISGSSQALGIEQGNDISHAFSSAGTNPLFHTLPVFLIMFLGSFSITLIWCLIMAYQNRTIHLFVQTPNTPVGRNYLFCGLAGFLWFINLIFFGMGKNYMGEFSFTAFGILMSLTIVAATLWGLYRGEWRSTNTQTKLSMYIGLLLLVTASFIIGISGQ